MPDSNFAFLLPVIMLILGCAFLGVAKSGSVSARYWGIGHLLLAGAFSAPLLAERVPIVVQALTADGLFLIAFLFFNQALLTRFDQKRYIGPQVTFAVIAFAVVAYGVVVLRSLPAELMAHDFASVCLLAFPLFFVARHARRFLDRAVIGLTGIMVADTIIRNLVLIVFFPAGDVSPEDFAASSYAFFMQATAGIFGLLFAVFALAAAAMDIIDKYRMAAEKDPLTGLLNRRGFEEVLQRLSPAQLSLGAIITCDIDHFKRVNDTFGHAAGDRILEGLAAVLREGMPADAAIARFGGEEFVAYMPARTLADAEQMATGLRLTLANRDWRGIGIPSRVTASFGVSRFTTDDRSWHEAIARADEALYDAKRAGRNKVVVSSGPRRGMPPVRLASIA